MPLSDTLPNKLTIEEVSSIIAGCKTALAVPEWKELAENTAKLAQQLADTMRENERLQATLEYIAVGEDTSVADLIGQAESYRNKQSEGLPIITVSETGPLITAACASSKQSDTNGTYASTEEWRKEPPKKSDVEQLQHNAINRGLQTPAKHSENRDWNCEHSISHKQCGSCYDQKEPPFAEGLGGRFQLPYTKTLLPTICTSCGCILPNLNTACSCIIPSER